MGNSDSGAPSSPPSATEAAKQRGERVGAPPVAAMPRPSFSRSSPPAHRSEGPPNPRARDPEVIKQDLKKAMEVLSGEAPPVEEKEPEKEEPKSGGARVGDFKEEAMWNQYRSAVEEYSAERKIDGGQVNYSHESVRKAIEGRAPRLAIEELILNDSVEQLQVIIPGKLEVVMRSLTTSEDLELKGYIYELEGSDRYILDSLTVMTLTCGLVSINGAQLPTHLSEKDGQFLFDKERFQKKYAAVKRLGLHLIALLSVTYMWFDARIRAELVDSVLGKS